MLSHTQGLVLRETNYREADKILTVLTRDMGKRTVKARGCRRRGSQLAASAQLLVFSDMTLFDYRDRLTLNEAESLEQFRGIREDIELLSLSSYFAEVTEAVAEEGRDQPELLSLILNSMYALDKLKKPQPLVKAAFELRLACLAGYEPLLEVCSDCGSPNAGAKGLCLEDGVLRCRPCRNEPGAEFPPVPAGALDAMRHVACGDPKRLFSFGLEGEALAALAAAAEAFLLAQLDRSFRTLDFYKELTRAGREQP